MQFECIQVARIVLDARGWENMNLKKKKTLNGINDVKCHRLFHIVSITNGHMPLH